MMQFQFPEVLHQYPTSHILFQNKASILMSAVTINCCRYRCSHPSTDDRLETIPG
uniref:Uncharacterized protein n=1 Tax=Yersinia enterocolitica TaxID=630 RepID=B0RKQ4_YEREN|nr:hypothetical protein [Yersinia enterocolitica]